MDTQASDLTTRYAEVLDAVITAVEPLDAASLRRLCPAEQCTVAALACHIAAVHGAAAGFVRAIVAGEALPPLTMEDIDRNNAENAAGNAARGKDEVIARLRAGGEAMTTELRGLGEDDLARTEPFTLFGGEVSVHTLVEQAVITHTEQHLASLQAAVGTEASTSDNG
jgi:hypothetical protein